MRIDIMVGTSLHFNVLTDIEVSFLNNVKNHEVHWPLLSMTAEYMKGDEEKNKEKKIPCKMKNIRGNISQAL